MGQAIRPLAICVFRQQDRILVAEGLDSATGEVFYRPLGGAIEFGEHSTETLVRELREEIDAEVADLRYLGTIENIFTYNGRKGHEIVLVYDGSFVDESFYGKAWLKGYEVDENWGLFKAVWKSLNELREGSAPLYPAGLLDLLEDGQ